MRGDYNTINWCAVCATLQGKLPLSEQEEEFLLAYNAFTLIQAVEDTSSESLIGGDASVEDVPTLMDFSQPDSENKDNDFQDIDIKF